MLCLPNMNCVAVYRVLLTMLGVHVLRYTMTCLVMHRRYEQEFDVALSLVYYSSQSQKSFLQCGLGLTPLFLVYQQLAESSQYQQYRMIANHVAIFAFVEIVLASLVTYILRTCQVLSERFQREEYDMHPMRRDAIIYSGGFNEFYEEGYVC